MLKTGGDPRLHVLETVVREQSIDFALTHFRDYGFTTRCTTCRALKPVLGNVRGRG